MSIIAASWLIINHAISRRHYKEVREFSGTDRSKSYKFNASFFFITKCHSIQLEDYLLTYKRRHGHPDLILILSALWDINRWGPNGIPNYIMNCERFLKFVQYEFRSKTQLIWLTCPPISVEVWGGNLSFLLWDYSLHLPSGLVVEGMEFQKRSMRLVLFLAFKHFATSAGLTWWRRTWWSRRKLLHTDSMWWICITGCCTKSTRGWYNVYIISFMY